ncbi:MAG TPA: hypothetical protein VIF62_04675 [Labilithrix sp.]
MAENPRPPVAIRIVRPYANEDEFLEAELETIGKTSVILIGAHPRPTGVILRFEVTLGSGATILRGEGRVLAHKENAFRGQPGLSLRFTRLDPRSKALVDRVASLREARAGGRPSQPPPPPSIPPPTRTSTHPAASSDPALANALTQDTPSPAHASRPPPSSVQPPAPMPAVPPPAASAPPPQPPQVILRAISHAPIEEAPTHVETRTDFAPAPLATEAPEARMTDVPRTARASSGPLQPPADREDLLTRLRQRATTLPREKIEAILAERANAR